MYSAFLTYNIALERRKITISLIICSLSVLGYYYYNINGYHINAAEVEKVVVTENNQIDLTVEQQDLRTIETLIDQYNDVVCVKRCDGLGRVGTQENYITIVLKDGTAVSVYSDSVDIMGREYYVEFEALPDTWITKQEK